MKIVIIDDDQLVSISLKTILSADKNIEVLAVGNDGSEAVHLYDQHEPDILLMDIRMKDMTGLEAADVILKKHKTAKILFLTTFLDDEYIVRALNMGAKGYILKQDFEGIAPALQTVMSGQTVFGSTVVNKLPDILKKEPSFDYPKYNISDKEFEIIELVAQGKSNREIADKSCLSEGTVRNYLSIILEKLDLRDRTQLAIFYYQNGGKVKEKIRTDMEINK